MNSVRLGAIGVGLGLAIIGLIHISQRDPNSTNDPTPETMRGVAAQAAPNRGPAQAGSASSQNTQTPDQSNQASAPVVPAGPLSAHMVDDIARIDFLQKCFDANCDFPRTDEKSYDFAIGLELKKTIYDLTARIQDENRIDPQIASLARQELANVDGHVKEAALALLATQPTSAENLNSILNDVINSYDATLIEHAMLELARYNQPTDLAQIQQTLGQGMLTGAPFVSMTIAEHISLFINEQSFAYFSSVSGRLVQNSTTRKSLQSSLNTFRQKSTGA